MTGPVCPHCGDLARGCACPSGPYTDDPELTHIRTHEIRWTAGFRAVVSNPDLTGGELDRMTRELFPADQDARIAFGEGAECCRLALRLGEDVVASAEAGVYGPQVITIHGALSERDDLRDQLAAEREAHAHNLALARADLHREREANRPLRHEVEQARARVATIEQAVATLRDARQRADALASSGTVAMIEAYEAEDAAVVALLALLPDPSPAPGTLPP